MMLSLRIIAGTGAAFALSPCCAAPGTQDTKPVAARQKRPAQTLPARGIDRALTWLVRHQDEDGRFRAKGFAEHCPDEGCGGSGNEVNDVGVTSLALLGMLAAGSSERQGTAARHVKRATAWLRTQQDAANGLIGEASHHGYMYGHAMATLALVEARRMAGSTEPDPSLQKAVDYILKARNPYKVWRYYPHDGDNDSSVTGWMILALGAAKRAGYNLDNRVFQFAAAWFDEVTDPGNGRCGYTKRGQPSSRLVSTVDKFPATSNEALTALGICARLEIGQTPQDNPILLVAADSVLSKLPDWKPTEGRVDFYAWFYATRGLAALGGERASTWSGHVREALEEGQRGDGHAAGSWDPIGPWGSQGGRVYATALALYTLSVANGKNALGERE